MQQNQQEKNPAAWYYLGRISLQQGDIVGADTALTKAESCLPLVRKISAKSLQRMGAAGQRRYRVQQNREERFGPGPVSGGQHHLPG